MKEKKLWIRIEFDKDGDLKRVKSKDKDGSEEDWGQPVLIQEGPDDAPLKLCPDAVQKSNPGNDCRYVYHNGNWYEFCN